MDICLLASLGSLFNSGMLNHGTPFLLLVHVITIVN